MLAVELRPEQGTASGYESTAAEAVTRRLRTEHQVYARPLGNVVYLMVTPTSSREQCQELIGALAHVLAS